MIKHILGTNWALTRHNLGAKRAHELGTNTGHMHTCYRLCQKAFRLSKCIGKKYIVNRYTVTLLYRHTITQLHSRYVLISNT